MPTSPQSLLPFYPASKFFAVFVFVMGTLSAPLFSRLALAQTVAGSIVGNVTDPSGARVAGAKVTATDLGTNEKHTAESDSTGLYRLLNLAPANYRLDVEKTGFKLFSVGSVEVRVQSEARIDVTMEVGAATETVRVTAETPLLQTESGSVSDVVEGQRVQEMPLNGRNTMNLVALTPGVVAGAPSGPSALNLGTHTANQTWSDYAIGGGLTGASAMYIDGATVNLLGGNPIAFIPTQDAVQEFRIVSSGASPEFGRYGGGVINMASKSGTNQFHGTVYEYIRNKVLNANNFFSIQSGQPRPEWTQNQFGVTLGNPIVKDKVFSFFSWEGFHLRLGVPAFTNVPTQALRSGTFNHAIQDPLAAQTGRTGCITTPSAGVWQINPNCFDATAKVMLNDWPLPNSTSATGNFVSTPVTGNDANEYTERVDFNLSDKQRLFARYTYWGQVDIPYNQLGISFTANAFSHNRSQQAVVGDTYTLGPTSILDVRLAYVRQYTDNVPFSLNSDLSSYGSNWASLQTQLNPRIIPGPHVLGPGGYYPLIGMDVFSITRLNDYDLDASFTKIITNHSLKFGGEIRLSDNNAYPFTLDGAGFMTFLPLPFLSGDNFADFLFGVPANVTFQKVSPASSYNWYQGYYASDVWQASRKLTLNLGLRWELPGSVAERNDKDTVLLPNTNDPATGVRGTLALTQSSLYPSKYVSDIRTDLFSPRLGIAYRITDSNVARAGYVLTYYPPDLPGGMLATNSPVNLGSTAWSNTPTGSTATSDGSHLTLNNPFPTKWFPNGIINPVGRNVTSAWRQSLMGQTLSGPVPHQPYPWSQQWNFSLAHQFPRSLMLEGSYAGSTSQNLPTGTFSLDELASQYWTPTGEIQSNRPYGATYLDVQNTAANVGVSSYNSGIVKLEKRFGTGGVISGNYTYAKSLADVESPVGAGNGASATPNTGNGLNYAAQDYNNFRKGEYSLSSFDVRHRVVVSYVLDLPFGEGKAFAHYNGVAGRLVSGWTVNGITEFRKGFPMQFTQSGNALTNSFGAGTLRPNTVAGCSPANSGAAKNRLSNYFKTSCYTPVDDYHLGSEPRTDGRVRMPGVDNWDLSFLKTTKIKEATNVQFRAEFFNIFNHPQFAPPASQVDGANFGIITNQINNPRLVQFSLRVNY